MTAGIDFALPTGWLCVDLRQANLSGRFTEMCGMLGGELTDTVSKTRAFVDQLIAQDAHCLLLHPARHADDIAISGGVFVHAPLAVSGEELLDALERQGEMVAMGDLGGMPLVSLVKRQPGTGAQITYFIAADAALVILIFVAAARSDLRRLVTEAAGVVCAARVVR